MEEEEYLNKAIGAHENVSAVLQTRCTNIRAAKSHFVNNDVSTLVTYLTKTKDRDLISDMMPFITLCIKTKEMDVSLGSVLELVLLIQIILASRYEDHIIHGMDALRAVLTRWWNDIKRCKENIDPRCQRSLSVAPIYKSVISFRARIDKLQLRHGRLGDRAKVLMTYMNQF